MAITRGATITTYTNSTTVGAVTQSHTVDTSTSLLILVISQTASESITVVPKWDGTEMTLVHATTSSGQSSDVRNHVYGLVNPDVKTANITYTSSTANNIHHTAINYIGTDTGSVARAAKYLNEDVNDTGTGTTVLASGGASGSTLLAAGVFYGGDGDPSSNATGFAELADGATGTSTLSDNSFYVADKIGGAPSAITITWNTTDENAGQLIEILEAPTAVTGYGSNGGLAVNAATGTTVSPSYPLTIEGELIFLLALCNNNLYDWNTPSGWTVMDDNNDAGTEGIGWALFAKIADGTEEGTQDVVLSTSTTGGKFGIIFRYGFGSGIKGSLRSIYGKTVDAVAWADLSIDLGTNNSPLDATAVVICFSEDETDLDDSGTTGYTVDVNLSDAGDSGIRVYGYSQSVAQGAADGIVDIAHGTEYVGGIGFYIYPSHRSFIV